MQDAELSLVKEYGDRLSFILKRAKISYTPGKEWRFVISATSQAAKINDSHEQQIAKKNHRDTDRSA